MRSTSSRLLQLLLSIVALLTSSKSNFIHSNYQLSSNIFDATLNLTQYALQSSKDRICGIQADVSINGNTRPFKLMMTCSHSYLSVFMNWLIFYNRICEDVSPLYIICLDQETDLLLPSYGLKCSQRYFMSINNKSEVHLWTLRVNIAFQLLKNKTDVFMVDSDAILMKNPFPLFNRFPLATVISSRASMPFHISNQIGATLCMGFIYIKSNEYSIGLFDNLYQMMLQSPKPDDQKHINELLINKHNLHYSKKRLLYVNSVLINVGEFKVSNKTTQLALLPHVAVIRICNNLSRIDIQSSIAAHCRSLSYEKSFHLKLSEQVKHGLWLIKDNWNKTVFANNFTSFLRAIS
eukprot:gene11232-15072_t